MEGEVDFEEGDAEVPHPCSSEPLTGGVGCCLPLTPFLQVEVCSGETPACLWDSEMWVCQQLGHWREEEAAEFGWAFSPRIKAQGTDVG